ncbi:tRNA pseudouridine(55) synthase TruB [Bacillus sp. RAR_GA_16]|uniref:tRNA pseudouridine(55) synthase TruB n=1 Tax=Bacillus sp. RAR_GA_16 TaxID=2876774 RepID=UPI001CCE4FD5|nr:tRNA pseudouridine(55) synthase TruB [Bacillus sp. RAR_GA_16]MCA0174301.1 tRNA pseudouridine(55) synthase TruB [Bacillus sp. RAR_GA_16]
MNGILPLKKPAGMTSHDCVAVTRKLLHTKKVGHTGTLDPDVTGVLPLCIGRATKVAQYMTDFSKTYEAVITLGFSTTTEDASGEKVEEKKVDKIPSTNEIEEALATFKGTIEQVPPMYSAVKINGKKLYEYAFKGEVVERPSRQVTIHELDRIGEVREEDGTVSIPVRVTCSKGTYIRTLAVDVGEHLGYPAHMSFLIRTASGPFKLEECLTFDEIKQMIEEETLSLFPMEYALSTMPSLTVTPDLEAKLQNGAVLPQVNEMTGDRLVMYNNNGEAIAIYQKHPEKPGLMKPEKVFSR